MGHLFSKILDFFSNMRCRILILGLDAAGKTTILYKMKLKETIATIPTIGFNIQELKYKGLTFTIWDVGSQSKIIELWHHYFAGSDAIVYVIDSSDVERIQVAKDTFERVMQHENMPLCPVLIFANKMDLAKMEPDEIARKMELRKLKRPWHLQPCCAIDGKGIAEGFQWLRKEFKKKSDI